MGNGQHIEFKTDVKGLDEFAPVRPSKFFIPQWFKDINDSIPLAPQPEVQGNRFGKEGEISKKFSHGTVKRCPAIVDIMKEGYIIPMWCDFLVQRDKKLLEWNNKGFPYGIEFHVNEQIYNWNLKKTDFPEGVKFINPWRIHTPPGYSVMFLPPYYQFEHRFTVLPGIVETDAYHQVNFPTIWHTNKDAIIDRGTPFIQVIPFKREDWSHSVSQMDELDKEEENKQKWELNTKFKNSYRSITARFKDGRHNKRRRFKVRGN